MPLNPFQKAFIGRDLVTKEQVIDPDTGEAVDWGSLGGGELPENVALTLEDPGAVWEANHAYADGDRILAADYVWLCFGPGNSGATEPDWDNPDNAEAGVINDGDLQWIVSGQVGELEITDQPGQFPLPRTLRELARGWFAAEPVFETLGNLAPHPAINTDVHGIADTSRLATLLSNPGVFWEAEHAYEDNARINVGGFVWETSSGTSGETEPEWPTILRSNTTPPYEVLDGTCAWTPLGAIGSVAVPETSVQNMIEEHHLLTTDVHGIADTSTLLDEAAHDLLDHTGLTGVGEGGGSGSAVGFIGASISEATAQSLTNDTPTALTSNDAEVFDTDGFHDTGSNTSRMTVPAGLAGKYLVNATVFFSANATGTRWVGFYKSGVDQGLQQRTPAISGMGQYVTATAVLDLTAGEYVEVFASQTSGGALNATLQRFSIVKLDSGQVGSGVGAKANEGGTTITTAWTQVALTSETFDTDGFHDNATNNQRMTIPAGLAGKYLVTGQIGLATAPGGGILDLSLQKNADAGDGFAFVRRAAVQYDHAQVTAVIDLAAGDYVTLRARAASGTYTLYDTWLSIMRLDALPVPQDVMDALALGPVGFIGARAYSVAEQTIATSTSTALALDSEEFDTDGFHNNSTNNSRFTVPAGLAGKYLVTAVVPWRAGATGTRQTWLRKNGNTVRATTVTMLGDGTNVVAQGTSAVLDLVAGDYVDAAVWQDSGSNKTIGHASTVDWQPSVSIVKLDSGRVGSGVGATAYATAVQSVASGVDTALALTAEEFDTDGFHDNSTNNTRFTVPAGLGGKYLLTGATYFVSASGAVGQALRWRKNGATIYGDTRGAATTAHQRRVSTAVVDLAAGDYVELMAYQDSGSASDVGHTGADTRTTASIVRLDALPVPTTRAARGTRTTAQNITTGTWTGVDMNVADTYDTNAIHDPSSNPSRFVLNATGIWSVKLRVSFDANGTGDRYLAIRLNGVQYGGSIRFPGNGTSGNHMTHTDDVQVTAITDYIECFVYQDSGGTLAVVAAQCAVAFLGA